MTLSREDREGLLEKIDLLVAKNYYDPSYGGNNWKGIITAYRDEIGDADKIRRSVCSFHRHDVEPTSLERPWPSWSLNQDPTT